MGLIGRPDGQYFTWGCRPQPLAPNVIGAFGLFKVDACALHGVVISGTKLACFRFPPHHLTVAASYLSI
jgi:hypothetical protein